MAKSTRSSRWAGARVVNLLKQGACLLRNEDCGNQVFQLAEAASLCTALRRTGNQIIRQTGSSLLRVEGASSQPSGAKIEHGNLLVPILYLKRKRKTTT